MKKAVYYLICLIIFNINIFCEKIEIYGKVVDKVTQNPIAQASVIAFPSGERIQTKDNGNFYLEIEDTGNIVIQVLKEGYKSLKFKDNIYEIFAQMELAAEVQGQKIIVRGKKDEKKVVVSRQNVDKEMIKGTTAQLFADAVEVVKTMPGVVSTGEFSSEMYVRGGDFYEVANYLDGAFILLPSIWGGAVSIYNPEMVDSIDFYSGAYPAEFGPAMSGVLDVQQRDGSSEEFKGFIDLSMTSSSAIFEGPIGEKGKTNNSYLIGIRRTYYDLVMNQIQDRSGVEFPFFYDIQARLKFHLNDKNVLRFSTMVIYEGMDIEYEDFQEEGDDEEEGEWEEGAAFKYESFRLLETINLSTSYTDALLFKNTFSYELMSQTLNYQADAVKDTYQDSVWNWNVIQHRFDTIWTPNDDHIIKTGVRLYWLAVDMTIDGQYTGVPDNFDPADPEYLSNWAAWGISQDTPGTPYELAAWFTDEIHLDWNNKPLFYPSIYMQDDIQLIENKLFMNIGARSEYMNVTEKATIEPRLGFKYNSSEDITWKIASGMYTNYPIMKNGEFLSEEYGNPDVKPEKSYHLVSGVEMDAKEWFVRLDGFGKYYDDLITEDHEYNYVNGEIGYSYGVDFFLQKKAVKNYISFWDRFDGWLSYSYIITRKKVMERTDTVAYNSDHPEDYPKQEYETPFREWYKPDYDRPHTVKFVLNFSFNKKWKISTVTKMGSGALTTPVIDAVAFESGGETNYSPIYGETNSVRMPYYLRTDIKLSMPFFWENWSSYIQVYNVLNRENKQTVDYSADYSSEEDESGFPIFGSFGIRAEF